MSLKTTYKDEMKVLRASRGLPRPYMKMYETPPIRTFRVGRPKLTQLTNQGYGCVRGVEMSIVVKFVSHVWVFFVSLKKLQRRWRRRWMSRPEKKKKKREERERSLGFSDWMLE